MKEIIYEKTKKGKEVLKIVNSIEKFKKKYPEKCSQSLEFVGIHDDKAVMRILKKILKGTKYEKSLEKYKKSKNRLKKDIEKFYEEFDEDMDKLYQEEYQQMVKGKYKSKLKYPESFYEHWKKRMEDFILKEIK